MKYIVYIALILAGIFYGAFMVAMVNLYSDDNGWSDGCENKEKDEI